MATDCTVFKGTALLLVFCMLASCSMSPVGPGNPSKEWIMSESAKMIDANFELVRSELEKSNELPELESHGVFTGEEVVRGVLTEENGEAYLNFLYKTDKFTSVDEVIAAAEDLVPEGALDEIKTEADQIEKMIISEGEMLAKGLNESQKNEFYKDLRALVIKSVVLLTASIVYAFMPKTLFWGKISAASAMAIAAGILASTIIAIIEWKDTGKIGTSTDSFDQWLTEITEEPVTAWAIAAGMINTCTALGATPLTTALIMGVFAIYDIMNDLKPVLEKYNLKV